VVYLKAGGSFLTNKEKPFSLNFRALSSLAKILKDVPAELPLVLGNGGGSFAHTVVKAMRDKYGARPLLVRCQSTTRWLNKLVVDYLVLEGVDATSIQTSAIITGGPGGFVVNHLPVVMSIKRGIRPVVYGECVFTEDGYSVLSTEAVFSLLAERIRPSLFVFLMDVEGVYTCDPKKCEEPELIPRIDSSNAGRVLKSLGARSATDATGGISGKVRSAIELSAKFGVPVVLMSGFNTDDAVKALTGQLEDVRGTVVYLGR
jgi:isopentenyl phosphate kinase